MAVAGDAQDHAHAHPGDVDVGLGDQALGVGEVGFQQRAPLQGRRQPHVRRQVAETAQAEDGEAGHQGQVGQRPASHRPPPWSSGWLMVPRPPLTGYTRHSWFPCSSVALITEASSWKSSLIEPVCGETLPKITSALAV